VPAWDHDPEGVAAEQVRGDLGRGECGPADAYVEAAVDQLLVLLGHAGFDLVDYQAGVAGLDLVQDLRVPTVGVAHTCGLTGSINVVLGTTYEPSG
jgi:hypothetical protein